jgi:abortive infection bacteriophage resistance protein
VAKFSKPALSIPDLLQKWKSRGLIVASDPQARLYLRFIGYYRFSAYAFTFQQIRLPDKRFIPGTSFEDILDLYRFDRELRLLVLDAIERIEVAVRSCFVNETSRKWGPHWYMDSNHFRASYNHPKLLEKIESELGIAPGGQRPRRPSKHHQELFINHYYSAYGDPDLPPIWMVCECLSFGAWSQMFSNLASGPDRQRIAQHFDGLNEAILTNWLHALSYVRNVCAHHCRLWNRSFVIKFKIAKKHQNFLTCDDRFYAVAVVAHELLQIIAPANRWTSTLLALLNKYPSVSQIAMGFPANWQTEPFWGLQPLQPSAPAPVLPRP